MGDVTRPQQDPKPGRTEILPLVIADLEQRAKAGFEKYGSKLMSENGRDAMVDAYQEAQDLVMYLRQALEERNESRNDDLDAVDFMFNPGVTAREFLGRTEARQTRLAIEDRLIAEGCTTREKLDLEKRETQEKLKKLALGGDYSRPGRFIPVNGPMPCTSEWCGTTIDFSGYVQEDLRQGIGRGSLLDEVEKEMNESIAHEAHRLVHGDRGAQYGSPLDDFGRTAGMASALLQDKLKSDLTAEDVALLMICVKLSRAANMMKRDTVVDIAGYAEALWLVVEERANRNGEDRPQ